MYLPFGDQSVDEYVNFPITVSYKLTEKSELVSIVDSSIFQYNPSLIILLSLNSEHVPTLDIMLSSYRCWNRDIHRRSTFPPTHLHSLLRHRAKGNARLSEALF